MDKQGTSSKNLFTSRWLLITGALFCTILWGTAIPLIKTGYIFYEIAPNAIGDKLLFAGVRFFLSGIIVLVLHAIIKKKWYRPQKPFLKKSFLLGAVQTFLQYMLGYIGLSYCSGTRASLINTFGTFLAIVVGMLLFKDDAVTKRKVMGSIIGFAGVAMNFVNLGKQQPPSFMGEGMAAASAACFATAFLYSKKAAQGEDAMALTGYQMLIGSLMLFALGIPFGGQLHLIGYWKGNAVLIYLALQGALTFPLWTTLLKHNPVSKVMLFNFFVPVVGVLSSFVLSQLGILQNETALSMQTMVSLLAVCTAIYIVNK